MFHFFRHHKTNKATANSAPARGLVRPTAAPCAIPRMYCCGAPNGVCDGQTQRLWLDESDDRPSPMGSLMFPSGATDQRP
jgi:hypothetical protein